MFPDNTIEDVPRVEVKVQLRVVNAPEPKPGDAPVRLSGISQTFGETPLSFSVLGLRILLSLGEFFLDTGLLTAAQAGEELRLLVAHLQKTRITEPELPLDARESETKDDVQETF